MLECRWTAMQITNDESSSLSVLREELYVVCYINFLLCGIHFSLLGAVYSGSPNKVNRGWLA